MRIGTADLQGVVEPGLCDTATSITVRRPGLSLSRDPVYRGVCSRPYTQRNIERVCPRCVWVDRLVHVCTCARDLPRSGRAITGTQGSKGA